MRCICRVCNRLITGWRSSHLKQAHGIDTSGKGAVKEYFLTPEEYGISWNELANVQEGDVVPRKRD